LFNQPTIECSSDNTTTKGKKAKLNFYPTPMNKWTIESLEEIMDVKKNGHNTLR
jgi:hypothetical protein